MREAPCAGQWKIFDSLDLVDHHEARQLCQTCPIVDWCREQLEAARSDAHRYQYGPQGTWAGELVGVTAGCVRSSAKTLEAEEAMFSEADARIAHNDFTRGVITEWTATGERVYQRRIGRQKRARRKDDAA